MKRPNLRRLLKKWQRRLRLQDWDISIRYVRYDESWSSSYGACNVHVDTKSAQIRVRPPAEAYVRSEKLTFISKDIENTVVHELLHVWTQLIQDGSDKNAHEHATRAITEALLKK